MKSMDERYALIRKALTGGKKMLLQEIAAAIDEDKSRTRRRWRECVSSAGLPGRAADCVELKQSIFWHQCWKYRQKVRTRQKYRQKPNARLKRKPRCRGRNLGERHRQDERAGAGRHTVTVQVSDTIEKSLTIAPQGESDQQAPHLVRVTGGHSITYADL